MKVTNVMNVKKSKDVADISIVGDIGYNVWADNEADYKKNTSENIALELNALQGLKVKTINLTLESLGGDVMHALAIYNLLKQSDAKINVFLRGINASASTIIASATNVENIYMDNTGLYLIHKAMTDASGNANDFQDALNQLDKFQNSIEQVFLNLGIEQSVLSDLMERNGGHGEWLTFTEAKEFGFVGNEWTAKKVTNYTKQQFTNRHIIVPNNLINNLPKPKRMEENEKKSLFEEFKNLFKNEALIQAAEDDAEQELKDLQDENEALKVKISELEAMIVELQPKEEEEVMEDKVEDVVTNEVVIVEPTMEEIINAKVKEEIKNLAKPSTEKTNSKKDDNKKTPIWKQHLTNYQNFIK